MIEDTIEIKYPVEKLWIVQLCSVKLIKYKA